jgi:chromosome segregation ATPase
MDLSLIITIVPPFLTAATAYLIARRKYAISQKISAAKFESDAQNQALIIVREVMHDMREDFRKEIDDLKLENKKLGEITEQNKRRIKDLEDQLNANDILIESLRSEISTLKKTISLYEQEIQRLTNR